MKYYYILNNQSGGNIYEIRKQVSGLNLLNLNKCYEYAKNINNNKNIIEIGSGASGIVYLINNEDCGTVVVKKYNKTHTNSFNKETNALFAVKQLIIKNICPHYIFMYGFNKKDETILLEYADGDIKKLYNNFDIKLTNDFIYSFFFQILYAIMCQNELCNISHNDILPNNILKKSIDKDKIFVYNINNKKFYIPTFGNLFMITDYGSSTIKKNKTNYDFKQFTKNILSLFAKHLILKGYDTNDKFYKIVSKEKIIKNSIDVTNKLRKIITECLYKQLFNYKNFFENYNMIEITLNIMQYDNIIDAIENIYVKFTQKPINNVKIVELLPINIKH